MSKSGRERSTQKEGSGYFRKLAEAWTLGIMFKTIEDIHTLLHLYFSPLLYNIPHFDIRGVGCFEHKWGKDFHLTLAHACI